MRRRTLLTMPAIGLLPTPLLGACADGSGVGRADEDPVGPGQDGAVRITYGDDPSQLVELHRPSTPSRGVVVVIHGGFWKSAYDHTLGTPLARSLGEQGWTAWNIEYRRVGNGGGTPETFDDVAAAIDALADVDGLDLSTVVTLGHSAGGHLAVWAAGRPDPGVRVTHAISQAGVLDLVASDRAGLGGGAAAALLGHPAGAGDAQWDPRQQIPLDVPVWAVHARDDDTVPFAQAAAYVDAATAAGAEATLVEVTGGHFGVIDPDSDAWAAQLEVLDGIG